MGIVIVFFPGWDLIKFEINLSFLSKPFSHMTKKVRTKFKYLKNKDSFEGKMKISFPHFYRTFIKVNKKISLEGESAALSQTKSNFVILRFQNFIFLNLATKDKYVLLNNLENKHSLVMQFS